MWHLVLSLQQSFTKVHLVAILKHTHMSERNRAFTLIELLVTIGIVMILMTITILSLNIDRQFRSAREAKRSADVRVILDSVTQYLIDQKENNIIPKDNISRYLSEGVYTPTRLGNPIPVPTPGLNLCTILIPKYMAEMPIDPMFDAEGSGSSEDCDNYHTGYMITSSADGRITVSAPFSEIAPIIAVR